MAASAIPLSEGFNWLALKLKLTEGNPVSEYVALTHDLLTAMRTIIEQISSSEITFRNVNLRKFNFILDC